MKYLCYTCEKIFSENKIVLRLPKGQNLLIPYCKRCMKDILKVERKRCQNLDN